MARRNDHSRQEIQQMAIGAAIGILSREGLQGLSTRKVATAIGYTVGTLYLVFKNLDDLILHINAATLDTLHERMQAALHKDDVPHVQLLNMSHAYLRFAREHFALWSLLYTHHLAGDVEPPIWFYDKVRGLFSLVAGPLQQLNPSLAEKAYQQATRVLWSSVHGICVLSLDDKLSMGGEMRAEELIDALIRNFLNGFSQGWE